MFQKLVHKAYKTWFSRIFPNKLVERLWQRAAADQHIILPVLYDMLFNALFASESMYRELLGHHCWTYIWLCCVLALEKMLSIFCFWVLRPRAFAPICFVCFACWALLTSSTTCFQLSNFCFCHIYDVALDAVQATSALRFCTWFIFVYIVSACFSIILYCSWHVWSSTSLVSFVKQLPNWLSLTCQGWLSPCARSLLSVRDIENAQHFRTFAVDPERLSKWDSFEMDLIHFCWSRCNSFKSGQIAQAVLWIESNMNVRSLIYGFVRALWFCSLEIARSQAMISTRRSGWAWTSWRQS